MTGLVVLFVVLGVVLGGSATTFGLWLHRKSAAGKAEALS